MFFSTFTHVHKIVFLITFCVCIFCNFFNRSEISIKFCVFWYLIWIFSNKFFWGLISTLSHFLQTLKLNPHRMAQKMEKRLFKIGVKFTCNIHICIVLLNFLKKKFQITSLHSIVQFYLTVNDDFAWCVPESVNRWKWLESFYNTW